MGKPQLGAACGCFMPQFPCAGGELLGSPYGNEGLLIFTCRYMFALPVGSGETGLYSWSSLGMGRCLISSQLRGGDNRQGY